MNLMHLKQIHQTIWFLPIFFNWLTTHWHETLKINNKLIEENTNKRASKKNRERKNQIKEEEDMFIFYVC